MKTLNDVVKAFWDMARLAYELIPCDDSELEENCLEKYDTNINEFETIIEDLQNDKRRKIYR